MDSIQQRQHDLEQNIQETLKLQKQLENNLLFEDDPQRKGKLKKQIDEQKKHRQQFEEELNSLNLPKKRSSPRPKHFFTLDKYLDSSNKRYWPKRQDLQEEKLYHPEDYIQQIQKKLLENKRCLLVGKSASGKTSLATAFSLWWRDTQENKTQDSDAVVFYLDASRGYLEAEGENWHQQICSRDRQNELFIIDNCHLSSAAVNAFCSQWELQPPERALVILISAPKVVESEWDEQPEDYFESFAQTGAVVEVQPEQIYTGVLRVYSNAYCLADPERFVSVDQDLTDSEQAQQLENLCGHNLAAARSMLEAWDENGGRLSSITEDKVLDALTRRYLTEKKVEILGQLCCLAQFEIPAHQRFVRQLPQESITLLQQENLLVADDSPSYGRCYKLTFHPQEAVLVFKAYVRMQEGSAYRDCLDEKAFLILKEYLSVAPTNFSQTYYQLKRNGATKLQQLLLRDTELQKTHAAFNFTKRPLGDVVSYLYILSQIEPSRSQTLLQDLINHTGVEEFRKRMLALTGGQLRWAIFCLTKVSLDSGRLVFNDLSPEALGQKLNGHSVGVIRTFLRQLGNFGYSKALLQQVIQVIDLSTLAQKAEQGSMQALAWFLDDLINVDQEQAKLFVEKLSPETLGQKLSGQPLSVIHKVFNALRKLNYNSALLQPLADTLDVTALAINAQDASLQTFYWLMRDLKAISPKLAERLMTHITPAGLAKKFREEQAILQNISVFRQVASYSFMQDFWRQLDDEEIVAMFKRSRLGRIGSFLEYGFYHFEQTYTIFATQSLRDKLATAEIDEIGTFITRLLHVAQEGKRLATQALELLIETDLTARVVNTDVEKLAVLLHNADSVDRSYSWFLINTLVPSGAVEEAIKHSRIRGIQLLLRNLSEMAPEFLPSIGQFLQNMDLTNRILQAEIKDLRCFLWNVRAYVQEELAKNYCQIVDAQLSSEQIANAELSELAALLWNLVHISDRDNLQTLNQPILLERLHNEWNSYPGHCAWIWGVMLVVRPWVAQDPSFLSFNFKYVQGMLAHWLTTHIDENNPYAFALTVKALRARDERQAVKVVQRTFQQSNANNKCLVLLQEAIENFLTPRSKEVLEETIGFIKRLPT